MRALGFEVTENVGKTGLVAIYKNGDGPTIMVRTELDGLPMEEKTGLDYASHDKTTWHGRETPVAHSCGHDIHMASWVGTAKTLLGLKDQWHGTLMFIAQPAEEIVCRRQSYAGRWPVHAISKAGRCVRTRMELAPAAYGTIAPYRAGVGSSIADGLEITFHGRRRSRRGAAGNHRSRGDGGALRRRCAERDQPRKGSDRIRRCHASARSRAAPLANIIPDDVRADREPSAASSRRFAPRLHAQVSSGQRRPPPPCRMRRRPLIMITRGHQGRDE